MKARTLNLRPEIDSTSIPHFISFARRQCVLESNIEGKTRRITDRKRLGQRFTLTQIHEYGDEDARPQLELTSSPIE